VTSGRKTGGMHDVDKHDDARQSRLPPRRYGGYDGDRRRRDVTRESGGGGQPSWTMPRRCWASGRARGARPASPTCARAAPGFPAPGAVEDVVDLLIGAPGGMVSGEVLQERLGALALPASQGIGPEWLRPSERASRESCGGAFGRAHRRGHCSCVAACSEGRRAAPVIQQPAARLRVSVPATDTTTCPSGSVSREARTS